MTILPPSIKRRRVARACDSCRDLKAKVKHTHLLSLDWSYTNITCHQCDGNRPTCGRCAGYGYTCQWNSGNRRKTTPVSSCGEMGLFSADAETRKLRHAIDIYDNLIRDLRDGLTERDRRTIDLALASLPVFEYAPIHGAKAALASSPSPEEVGSEASISATSRRYLGEASDIRFFRAMKLVLSGNIQYGQQSAGVLDGQVDSYEQQDIQPQCATGQNYSLLPTRANADRFVEIYFSTIHIAYPFISQPDFRRTYESFWESGSLEGFREAWLCLLCKTLQIPPLVVHIHLSFGRKASVILFTSHTAWCLDIGKQTGCRPRETAVPDRTPNSQYSTY